LDDAE
jgi:tetratricopeptide repeat protein 21B